MVTAFGFTGGVLLWGGSVWGYRLSLIAWALVVLTSLASVMSLYQTPNVAETLATTWMTKDVFYILIAVPMMYVLARDLKN